MTLFEVVELLGPRALLAVTLETGRTHQIRVHLEAIELPISGDPVYGVSGDLELERQFLHAGRLAFDHPITSERIDVESPLPRISPPRSSAPERWPDRSGLSVATLPRVVFPFVPAIRTGGGAGL